MGLDMYMHKYEICEETKKPCYKCHGKEVGYWRKAYPIALLFKERFNKIAEDEWTNYSVTKEDLKEVYAVLKEAHFNKKLHACFIKYRDESPHINSSEQRLFDENGEYNNNFYFMVEDSLCQIELILTLTNFDKEVIVYHESW